MEKKRLVSLDVLRGITIAGMILVNNAGGSMAYAPLRHSSWNGLTPCDLVFPFFLFIMGVSTYLSLYKSQFTPSSAVLWKILKRTLLILCIGWAIDWFHHICMGDFFPLGHLRLTGVLPRIALCYGIISVIALYLKHTYILSLSICILIGYALLLILGNGYICDNTNLLSIVDGKLLGFQHLYQKSPIDPEGIVSTLPSIAHTLIGFYCGKLIIRIKNLEQKVTELFLIGFILITAGWLISYALPLNKRIWSPTFVCLTCGAASVLLGMLMYFIDIKRFEGWSNPFVVFGVNPLFLYVLSEVLAIMFGAFGIKAGIYTLLESLVIDPYLASFLYAFLFTCMLFAAGYPLYKKGIYIKV